MKGTAVQGFDDNLPFSKSGRQHFDRQEESSRGDPFGPRAPGFARRHAGPALPFHARSTQQMSSPFSGEREPAIVGSWIPDRDSK
jgi:hypothetical protein